MGEDDRLRAIEKKLDEHGEILNGIRETLETVAVQHEQIRQIDGQVKELWLKYDTLVRQPDGVIPVMASYQASCPRSQIKWLWCVVVPQGLTLLGMGIGILVVLAGGS